MAGSTKHFVIALEEAYQDIEVMGHGPSLAAGMGMGSGMGTFMAQRGTRLLDLAEVRLLELDQAGIDFQVISHTPSPIQQSTPEIAVRLARGANDRLHLAIGNYPARFGAFAALPTRTRWQQQMNWNAL
jgi:predicted TIM-barrel fold metal-dependent hydrolase